MIEWLSLNDSEMLRKVTEESFKRDIIIFKHSTTCSISHMALMRMEDSWDLGDSITPYLVDVKSDRTVSADIAEKFSVHHESPQLLLLRNGECIYDASHLDITIDELKETLAFHANI